MAAKILFQYQSTSGATFGVSPSLVPDIEKLIDQVRAEIAEKRAAGHFVGYLSVPVSSKSGGDFATNIALAAQVTERVQREFGSRLWLLNPAAYDLPNGAGGGDYMAAWSDVLAGADGSGSDFDLVYFVGPSDVWQFFGVGEFDRLGTIAAWLKKRAASDPAYKAIEDDPVLRTRFLRYYGLRGSVIYSKGSHDEWNIVVAINTKRAIGNEVAVYFDGLPVEPGDYQTSVNAGYQTLLH
jgi:hypothetical protein